MLNYIAVAGAVLAAQPQIHPSCEVDTLRKQINQAFDPSKIHDTFDEQGNVIGQARISNLRIALDFMKVESKNYLPVLEAIEVKFTDSEKPLKFEHLQLYNVDLEACTATAPKEDFVQDASMYPADF